MDFGHTQFGNIISSTQQEEKAKYNVAAVKIRTACNLIRNMHRGSPHTKLVENNYGRVMITAQPSVIYDNMKMNHPFVVLLQEYVKKMDMVGGGASLFVALVSEMLAEAMCVVNKGVKPACLALSLREFCGDVARVTEELKHTHSVSFDDKEAISKVLRSVMGEKVLEKLLAEAVCLVKSFSAENIRICKVKSGSVEDSYVVEGMVFNRSPEGDVKFAVNVRTSIYNCPLDVSRTELKGTVLMRTASELLSFSKDENEKTSELVESIGADVVIFNGKIDRIYQDFFNKFKKLVFKVTSKHDIRRIRELLGGHVSSALVPQRDDEMGFVDKVSVITEEGNKYTRFVSGNKRVCTLVLKDSVEAMLDEHERVIQNGLTALEKNVISETVELVEGDGVFEEKLAEILLKKKFDPMSDAGLSYKCVGLALRLLKKGGAGEEHGIYNVKVKAIRYATEFLATFLETSDYLIGKPEKLTTTPRDNPNWDEYH